MKNARNIYMVDNFLVSCHVCASTGIIHHIEYLTLKTRRACEAKIIISGSGVYSDVD